MNTPPRLPTQNRRWVIPTIVTCVIGIPILMILIPFISFRTSNASAIRRLETKIKENKEPLTLKELAATYPPIPDEKNGAILFLELWGKDHPEFWKAFREGASSLPKRPEARLDDDLPYLGASARRISRKTDLPPASVNAAKAYLQDRNEHMNGIRRAL